MKIVVFLLFCSFLGSVLSFTFNDPKQDGVKFGELQPTGQIITADENNGNNLTVKIVLITEVEGPLTISVNSANKDLIDIQQETDATQTYLTAKCLDYEALIAENIPTNFPVEVYVNGDITTIQRLTLNIANIDDESPTFSSVACTMKENTPVNVDSSTCVFTISDPDGFLQSMDFSGIIGTNGESDLFEFAYKDPKPDDTVQSSDVYLVLKSGKTLDYETTLLYTFNVEAKDSVGHPTIPVSSVPVILQVEDQPDQSPRWDSGFKSAMTITEKTPWNISVSATDGDIGINNPINYEITSTTLDNVISIDQETGEIIGKEINRDEGNDQVVFGVKAYEVGDTESYIIGNITLIVEDLDDNVAVITVTGSDEKKIDITVDENTDDLHVEILAKDIDMGENAIYTATLEFGDVDYSSGFTIIPGRGYEETSLVLTILDPSKLNFEDADWKVITMNLLTTGTKTPTNTDVLPITITLNDINDELPKFDPTEYTVEVSEIAKAGTFIATIQATDKDQEDIDAGLKHELLGSLANRILTIEDLGGNITTKIDKAFDYEKQQEVIVQIQATDQYPHLSTAQLTITVLDVNDESPRIVVSSSITVLENQADGTLLDTQISASDEDEGSDLVFSIDWDSSYATKNSQRLKQEIFDTIHCVEVKTVTDPTTEKTVLAELSITETQPGGTPDFEVFDNLYIQLVVTDQNQEDGDGTDSALIVISIQDDNDNSPVFPEGTETQPRQVTENAALGTVITSPVATDADVGDNLTYSIASANDDTPVNWVVIDSTTGLITVNENIDCDADQIFDLKYDVTVTDGSHTTTVTITIDIIDQNDNSPTMDDLAAKLTEFKNGDNSGNGQVVLKLNPDDKDRDESYRTVTCSFATGTTVDVSNRFAVENNTIIVSLADGINLDREEFASFFFTLTCHDDPQRQGPNWNYINPPPAINITLDDINDNQPTITNVDITGYSETTTKGTTIDLQGEDKDAPDNPNSQIEFVEIKKIQRLLTTDPATVQEDPPQDLFLLATGENNKGVLTVNSDDLSGYYGYLILTISLTDKGEPALTNEVDVHIEVTKYNFKEPQFFFPTEGATFYLQTDQTPYSALVMFDGDTRMENINATDQQGGKFILVYEIVADSSGETKLFTVTNPGNSVGQLQLTTDTFERKVYTITIRAYIDDSSVQGSALSSKNVTINIDFFDKDNTDPIFTNNQGSVSFAENQIESTYQVESASYTKTDLPDDLPVYYLLKSGDESLFNLDSKTGVLTLKQELDYETTKSYDVVIQSSNSAVIKPNAIEDTRFYLTVEVEDVNDMAPVFEEKSYVSMMVTITETTGTVTTIKARDEDTTSQDKLTYNITKTTGSNEDLQNLKEAFRIDNSGVITFISTLKPSYEGYFTLDVVVRDEAPEYHNDTTEVTIYLVTNGNVIPFIFENDLEQVTASKDNISLVLNNVFKDYVSNVQNPSQGEEVNGNLRTSAPVYFVNTTANTPVISNDIYTKVTNANFFRDLRNAFQPIGLTLVSFSSDTTTTENMEATLQAWLIGVSVVLGALCLILLIAFILKTRVLNQRIDKLSNTKFGSQESGLNRTGVTAPTTNKHAVEGSNPVYNSEVDTRDIDRRSVTSGDSDLIGVEDDDKFNYDDPIDRENVIE